MRMDQEMRARLSQVRCFLLDMDGTFYLGNRLLEGSLAFLARLQETGRRALFVTNNSSRPAQAYVDKLSRMGVRAPFLNVLTSAQAAARYCLREHAGQRAYVLCSEPVRAELEGLGLLIDNERPDYVLATYDTTLTYEKLTRLCDLVRAGLPFVATHPDLNCPTETGFAPDLGAMLALVEASAGRRPDVIIGKPNAGIVEEALRLTGLAREELAMVGDRLYTDVETGLRFGMLSILVLTGEATLSDVERTGVRPDLIFERLSAMNAYL